MYSSYDENYKLQRIEFLKQLVAFTWVKAWIRMCFLLPLPSPIARSLKKLLIL